MANRRALEAQERRRTRLRWTAVAAALLVLAVGTVVVVDRLFGGRAVLLRGEHLDAALTEALRRDPKGKVTSLVECPERDLRRGESVVCAVSFTDGSSVRLRFGVKGRPGDVTPTIDLAE